MSVLSIFTDPFNGHIFTSTRFSPWETTVSIMTEVGIVQDQEISFIERSSEFVILTDPLNEYEVKADKQPVIMQQNVFELVEEILKGNIPKGYLPCQVEHKQWNPKKGVLLESNVQLEGLDQIHHLLQMMNTSNKRLTLSESELHVLCGRWVFLEVNILSPELKNLRHYRGWCV